MSQAPVTSGYAPVNGLRMYYEVHGTGHPLVLLHGAMSTIGVDFGAVLPGLAATRQVIAIEQQGHGHTADFDRPLNIPQLTSDTAAALEHLGVEQADMFGYSLGAGIGLELAVRHPRLVRKLAAASICSHIDGWHPGLLTEMDALRAEDLIGFPFQVDYARTAPDPDGWAGLVEKVKAWYRNPVAWEPEAITSVQAPVLLMIGDSDIVRPEHAVELFRLLGGGVPGDTAGLPRSRLAVLPATTHIGVVNRADWVLSMVTEFLDAPMPSAT